MLSSAVARPIVAATTLLATTALGHAAEHPSPPSPTTPSPTPATALCRNTASGATWRLLIDRDRGTVDGNAAEIGPRRIVWRDGRENRRYTLDLASGVLTVVVPSSTGGWIIWDRCAIGG